MYFLSLPLSNIFYIFKNKQPHINTRHKHSLLFDVFKGDDIASYILNF